MLKLNVYLDDLPDVAAARRIKTTARGRAILEGDRAAAVAFTGDGVAAPESWLVRFDVAEGQDARKMLADAFAMTGATTLWYFGGDTTTRRAAVEHALDSVPDISVFVRRAEPTVQPNRIDLRAAPSLDAQTRRLVVRHLEHFDNPRFAAALSGGEIVGYAILQELSPTWSEVSSFVFPAARNHGYGAEILAKSADAAENTGRMVCAGVPYVDATARSVLERAGFRLVDYYFAARARPKVANPGLGLA